MITRTVIYLDTTVTIGADAGTVSRPWPVPDDTFDSFAALLGRLAGRLVDDGTLVLSAAAAARLGWAARSGCQGKEFLSTDCVCTPVHIPGWTVYGSCGWWTYISRTAGTIRVAVLPWMRQGQNPLGAPLPGDLVARLDWWRRHMGTPYYGTAGGAATLALQNRYQDEIRPTWRPDPNSGRSNLSTWRSAEVACRGWEAPAAPLMRGELVGFDRIRAGLATFTSLQVAPHTLHRRTALGYQDITFDPGQAGMWLVRLAKWRHDWMPDPANRPPNVDPDELLWVATPTLMWLRELETAGEFGGFSIREAYTGAGRRVFREWGELLRDAWDATLDPGEFDTNGFDYHDRQVLRDTIKDGYRAAAGGMARDTTGGIYRLDWYNANEALARVTLSRAIWRAGCTGYYPVRVDGDCVWYDSAQGVPRTFPTEDPTDPTTNRLGRYRVVNRDGLLAGVSA